MSPSSSKIDVKTRASGGYKRFGAVRGTKRAVDRGNVCFDRSFRKVEFAADTLDGGALGKLSKDVKLTIRQMRRSRFGRFQTCACAGEEAVLLTFGQKL